MASSGVVLPALFNTAVGREMGQSSVREQNSSNNSSGPVARSKKMDFKDNVSEFGVSSLPLPQCGTHHTKQRAPAPAPGTVVTPQ